MKPMYNPQNDVGSIAKGFTRNYSPAEMKALQQFISSHGGSAESLVGSLTKAGVPLRDVALLAGGIGQGQGVAGMAAQTGRAPDNSVDMGGGYGGMAPPAYGSAPFRGSNSGLAALAGQAAEQPQFIGGDPMEEGIETPRFNGGYPMQDDPSLGYPNPGSSIKQMQNDLYPPQQPISYGGDGYPPQQPIGYGPEGKQMPYTGGGVYGPGGMFPSQTFDPYTPPIGISPYEGEPTVGNHQPIDYRVDPYSPSSQMMGGYAPRAPEGGISNEYYHATPDNSIPRDPLDELMGAIANDRIAQQGQAMKRGGIAEISQHPALMKLALNNRR